MDSLSEGSYVYSHKSPRQFQAAPHPYHCKCPLHRTKLVNTQLDLITKKHNICMDAIGISISLSLSLSLSLSAAAAAAAALGLCESHVVNKLSEYTGCMLPIHHHECLS